MRFWEGSSPICSGAVTAPTAVTGVLLSLLALSPPFVFASQNLPPQAQNPILQPPSIPESTKQIQTTTSESFKLRHILHHGAYKYPGLLRRLDVRPTDNFWVADTGAAPEPVPILKARSRKKPIQRLINRQKDVMEKFLLMQRYGWAQSFTADAWITEDISQPDITDKETVITLARMTADAYVEIPGTEDWVDIGAGWNITGDFGWEGDGLRGHIWMDDANTTVVIGVKGTSPAVFDGPDTTTNDKINDNLLFSCCCGRVSRWWKTVCDCYSGKAYTCGKTCLKKALLDENRYYRAALNLYYNVTHMYPDIHNVWFAGHSLGGSVSSLVGQTYSLPVVTFEAPGEALASSRLGLPVPPGDTYAQDWSGTYHFGHSADPLYMGTCNGATSPCNIGGYAMETGCHSGYECLYDVVKDKGWRVGLGYHRIQTVIKDVLESYPTVAECKPRKDCEDCILWKFVDANHTQTTTLSTTTTTSCKTKGWWGCLDDPTGTTTTNTTITSTTTPITSTTTPITSTTTLITSTTPAVIPTQTTTTTVTCTSYGWFGRCLDTTVTTPTSTTYATASITSTTTCSKYNWWGHCVEQIPTSTTRSCTLTGWLGDCRGPTGEPQDRLEPTTTAITTITAPPKLRGDGDGCHWWEFWCQERKVQSPVQELK